VHERADLRVLARNGARVAVTLLRLSERPPAREAGRGGR
jgi:hypothetical protein